MGEYVLYRITCSVNDKVYIGYTAKTAYARFMMHLRNARWKKKSALYDAIRAYGNEAFHVEWLRTVPNHADACAAEIMLIESHRSMLPGGYNMTRGGDGVPVPREVHIAAGARKRGRYTEKQRQYADSQVGRKQTPEHVENRRKTAIGSKRSSETRRRMSEAQKKRWATKPQEDRMRLALASKSVWDSLSDDEKQRRMLPAWEGQRKGTSHGRKEFSDEQKLKWRDRMLAGQKRYWEKRRADQRIDR